MKRFLIIVLLVFFVFSACGTVAPSSDDIAKKQTEKAMKEATSQIGMPAIKNFQEKKLVKMLYEIRDKENIVCYAYTKSDYTGKLIYLGKCIGYGVPYSAQFSNPEKEVFSSFQGGFGSLPQPEPNGLFVPDGLSATWLMMIDPNTGKARPVYVEPEIVVSPFKLH
jgi:hypothetical protein